MPKIISSSDEPSFWQEGTLRVFISHLATYRGFAAELKETLSSRGISCFVAHDDIEPTTEWQNQIETALKTCDGLIALLHPKFHESKWTDQEIGFVMGRNVPVFAVRLGETLYGFIGRFQAFNGNNKTTLQLAQELLKAYLKHDKTKDKTGEALINLFERSSSFANAREIMGYLEELQNWKPSYAKRIRDAAEWNSQISGSWGVGGRARNLATKWENSEE